MASKDHEVLLWLVIALFLVCCFLALFLVYKNYQAVQNIANVQARAGPRGPQGPQGPMGTELWSFETIAYNEQSVGVLTPQTNYIYDVTSLAPTNDVLLLIGPSPAGINFILNCTPTTDGTERRIFIESPVFYQYGHPLIIFTPESDPDYSFRLITKTSWFIQVTETIGYTFPLFFDDSLA